MGLELRLLSSCIRISTRMVRQRRLSWRAGLLRKRGSAFRSLTARLMNTAGREPGRMERSHVERPLPVADASRGGPLEMLLRSGIDLRSTVDHIYAAHMVSSAAR
jgi:hypothetical protein